jgi:hypothetical protein
MYVAFNVFWGWCTGVIDIHLNLPLSSASQWWWWRHSSSPEPSRALEELALRSLVLPCVTVPTVLPGDDLIRNLCVYSPNMQAGGQIRKATWVLVGYKGGCPQAVPSYRLTPLLGLILQVSSSSSNASLNYTRPSTLIVAMADDETDATSLLKLISLNDRFVPPKSIIPVSLPW